jgi:hypothetical protein
LVKVMTELVDIVAQRTLTSGNIKLVVSIARPVEDDGDFRCAFLLVGDGGIRKTGHAFGMDSVQALQLAMKKVGVDVIAIGKQVGAPFSWLEDEPGVNGFDNPVK